MHQVIADRKLEMMSKRKDGSEHVKSVKRKAFMDLLLDMHLSDPHNFTELDVQEEVDSFMFAVSFFSFLRLFEGVGAKKVSKSHFW